MGMRLLSVPAGKSRRETDNAAQELRSIQLDEAIRTKRKEITDLEGSLINSLSVLGARKYEEKQYWKAEIAGLEKEVEALESRKRSASVPLEEREKEVQAGESALLKREETLAIREAEVEHLKDVLEERLDEVSEREQAATDYSVTLNNREFAIQFQETQVRERTTALTTVLRESYEEMQKAKEEAAKRKALLKGRDVSVSEREKFVDMQEASFANREKAIVDRYQTLLRAITETNLRQNGDNNHQGNTC